MLIGKSIMHVNQDMGKCFIPGEIGGYFNNLTEKVTRDPTTLKNRSLPIVTDELAGNVYFPVAIFQYGLGAYDLYLMTQEDKYQEQFWNCVNYAFDHQEKSGAWNNFGFVCPDAPYGSMCQGEGASLLLRAYKESNDERYLNAAHKAVDYMLVPIESGGTAKYEKDNLFLYEFTNRAIVLNGWIFSLYGLYELTLIDKSNQYKTALCRTINTLEKSLSEFDNGYWSMYDLGGKIASPFYHKLHIAQLEALYKTFGTHRFEDYRKKFESYTRRRKNCCKAFIYKVLQKISD